MQAEALGLPVLFGSTTWEGYGQTFKEKVTSLKSQGINAGVFGDIDLAEHREWVERVCEELEITPLLPLWGKERRKLVEEFINVGLQAMIISVRKECLSGEWLGRTLNRTALNEPEEAGVDPAGEGGEFHTFVFAGPLFFHPVDFSLGEIIERDEHLQLQVTLRLRRPVLKPPLQRILASFDDTSQLHFWGQWRV